MPKRVDSRRIDLTFYLNIEGYKGITLDPFGMSNKVFYLNIEGYKEVDAVSGKVEENTVLSEHRGI